MIASEVAVTDRRQDGWRYVLAVLSDGSEWPVGAVRRRWLLTQSRPWGRVTGWRWHVRRSTAVAELVRRDEGPTDGCS